MATQPARPRATETQRIPPHSIDAEMSLLGSLMLSPDNDAFHDVLPIIGRDESHHFYRPAHRQIFETLIDIYDRNEPIDLVVVKNEFNRRELLEAVGGVAYLVQLAESVPSWVNAEHYARIVRDKALLRPLITCSGLILEDAYADQD